MRTIVALATAFLLSASAAFANEALVKVELNKLETDGANCQSYLVVENGTADPFDKLVLDLVMFDADGIIARRLAVDIAPIDAGKLSVKVFAIQSLACEAIGRILVNGVLGCEIAGASKEGCLDLVQTGSRASVELIN